jgi:hypothetical protein
MLTTLLTNVRPLDNDLALMSRLKSQTVPATPGEPNLCLGIEGPDGDVYRVIQSNSLCEVVRIFEALQRSGLEIDRGRYAAGRRLLRVFRVSS